MNFDFASSWNIIHPPSQNTIHHHEHLDMYLPRLDLNTFVPAFTLRLPFPAFSQDFYKERFFQGGSTQDLLTMIHTFYLERVNLNELLDILDNCIPSHVLMLNRYCDRIRENQPLRRIDIGGFTVRKASFAAIVDNTLELAL
jgi:hypothetical protein